MNKSANTRFPNWVYWVWVLAIISIGLSIASFFGVYHNVTWNVETVSLSIILAFVGILATFVVISNYSHVKEVEHTFDAKMLETREDYYKIINNSAANLMDFTMAISSMNMAKLYEETNKYLESINWYFTALKYAAAGNLRDELLTIVSAIHSVIINHNNEVKGLNAQWRERYINQLVKLAADYESETVSNIIEFLKQPESQTVNLFSSQAKNSNNEEKIDGLIETVKSQQRTIEIMTAKVAASSAGKQAKG